jgi:hypothetical protein
MNPAKDQGMALGLGCQRRGLSHPAQRGGGQGEGLWLIVIPARIPASAAAAGGPTTPPAPTCPNPSPRCAAGSCSDRPPTYRRIWRGGPLPCGPALAPARRRRPGRRRRARRRPRRLVAALASGGPADPDRRAEVITDRPTWTALFSTDPVDGWPRLHVADSPEQALTELDTRLLHRARILDDHGVADLAGLREQAPDEEAVPPILLLGHTPPAAADTRLRVTLGLGAGQDVTAVLLGSWQAGTVDVAADGRTNAGAGERVAVLDAPTALAALATQCEAHTGEPTAQSAPAASNALVAPPLDEAPATAPAVPSAKVRLRMLGEPRVEDVTRPGRPLRAKAAELAVFLACHPDGADTATIAEHLTPDARLRAATQQVHTNASNLRHVREPCAAADRPRWAWGLAGTSCVRVGGSLWGSPALQSSPDAGGSLIRSAAWGSPRRTSTGARAGRRRRRTPRARCARSPSISTGGWRSSQATSCSRRTRSPSRWP